MLKQLSVENYALIERLDLELSGGLNTITGETGAGKSILLGALALLLGSRSEGSTLKGSEKNCIVEGVFSIGELGLESFFEENDLEYASETTVRRVITAAGKSRAYINDLPVQTTTLKEFGAQLIDIHSQHQSLMLADDTFRTRMLDATAGHGALLSEYSAAYHGLRATEKLLAELRTAAAESRRDEDYLRFQCEQLAAAALRTGEEEELEQEQNELSHAGQIQEALGVSAAALAADETGALPVLKTVEQTLRRQEEVYAPAAELADRVRSAMLELRDVESELSSEAGRIESNPARLQEVEQRLSLIYDLQQKHRMESVEALITLHGEYAEKLAQITRSDEEIAALEIRIAASAENARKLAGGISANRTKAARTIEKQMSEILSGLGMLHAHFTVEVIPEGELRASGSDTIRFLFSANKNLAPQPVEKVASGGEISRVMLGLKSIVARHTQLPTIIFDEIDAGVSGRIADAMGEIICDLAECMQVVNITHLPQVASKGDTQFLVYKEEEGPEPRTRIRKLTPEERITEIAKMLSGSSVTEAALSQARILIRNPR